MLTSLPSSSVAVESLVVSSDASGNNSKEVESVASIGNPTPTVVTSSSTTTSTGNKPKKKDDDDSSDDEEGVSQRPPPPDCVVCGAKKGIYKCPRCDRRSCSLDCVKRHKADNDCDGLQTRSTFTSLPDIGEKTMLNGYPIPHYMSLLTVMI
jgi:hypothetical protein